MEAISMERVKGLDRIWAKESCECLQLGQIYSGPSPFFLQEKYLDGTDLFAMAKKWKVRVDELRIFVAVQRFVNAVANNDCKDLPSVEDIANQFDLPSADFESYLQEQVGLIREAQAVDDDDFTGDGPYANDDWDVDLDILAEAGRRGLCE
jgi:hypothetical protein